MLLKWTEGASIGWSPSSACPESPGIISKREKDMEVVKALEFGAIWKINYSMACTIDG